MEKVKDEHLISLIVLASNDGIIESKHYQDQYAYLCQYLNDCSNIRASSMCAKYTHDLIGGGFIKADEEWGRAAARDTKIKLNTETFK